MSGATVLGSEKLVITIDLSHPKPPRKTRLATTRSMEATDVPTWIKSAKGTRDACVACIGATTNAGDEDPLTFARRGKVDIEAKGQATPNTCILLKT